MAEEIALIIKIEGQDRAINSLKDLKQAKKDATDAFLRGDKDAAKALADLTDKTEDLADASRSLKGSGVEQSASSFRLLGDGFKNLDIDKIKTGFTGLGSAMKAIPLLLIVEGITYLVTNFDELSKGSGVLATALQAISSVISWLVDGFTDLIGTTSDATRALEEQGESIKSTSEATKEALAGTIAGFDRQILVAKTAGKNTVDLEKQKQQAIIDTNVAIAKQIEAFVRAGGVLDDEKKKLLTASLESIKNAKVQEYVITETDNKAKIEQYNKNLDKQKELDAKAQSQKLLDLQKQKEDEAAIELQSEHAIASDKLTDETASQEEINAMKAAADAKAYEEWLKTEEGKAAIRKARLEEDINITRGALQATQNLTDIYFNYKSAKLAKGSKEEEDNARKQFNITKGVQLGMAIIDGYKSISASLASSPVAIGGVPNPAGIASLAFAAISTAATIAKIASTKFTPSGGGSSSAPGGLSSPSIPSAAVPNITPPSTQPSTLLDQNGQPINNNKPQTIKVINVESESTKVQDDVKRVKNQATI